MSDKKITIGVNDILFEKEKWGYSGTYEVTDISQRMLNLIEQKTKSLFENWNGVLIRIYANGRKILIKIEVLIEL